MSKALYIVAAKRTAFGTFGGKLLNHSATSLAVHSSKAAISSAGIDPSIIDTVVFGNVAQTSEDAAYLARHVGLKSGVPVPSPALTVNRLCGSGFQAVISAAHEILNGEASIALCGGTENMSQAPFALRNNRFNNPRLGDTIKLEDTLWQALTDTHVNLPMAITAENLAEKYGISRQDCDDWALGSQKKWAAAQAAGRFESEIAPLEIAGKKGAVDIFKVDEHPRPNTLPEGLAKLAPVFKKGGTVTAGNASGISDGAASLIVASEEAVKQHNLKPLARIVAWQSVGVDPSIMGIGPAPAIRQVLKKAGLQLKDMELIEINEAFAAQVLAVSKELGGLDTSKLNTDGGAVALGHPLAASGARILTHLTHELQARKAKYGLGSACIGGGQGIAVILERV